MKTLDPKQIVVVLVAAAGLLVLGRCSAGWGSWSADARPSSEAGSQGDVQAQPPAALWTCPMHAQIQLPDPGDCPLCGMDLVPVSSAGDEGPRRLVMTPAARELAQIVTSAVRRKSVVRPIQLVGKVDFDQTAVRTISARVPGRLDRLYVDYAGVRVQLGDHLVWLYSPDLLSAQEELFSTSERLRATANEASEFLAESNRRAYQGAREKLLLWGLTEQQVAEIEARGTADDHMMITSPTSGVVVEKLVEEGDYVQTGSAIYQIADLSRLWVQIDAYEQDLAWLRYGQELVIEAEALPGELIAGSISFIDPFVDEATRTAKVRVNVENADGRLKPGMFVRAVAEARLGAGGRVQSPELAGKWVSPMHPEIVKDAPGSCDVCGMDLVSAESLGLVYAPADDAMLPLVVPTSAVLVTGKRAVVYVEVPDAERPTYEGREVSLGPRAADEYVVLSGLQEDERVVTNGAFRIDSSMQILAKPSMMDMRAERPRPAEPELQLLRVSLEPLYAAYFELQQALAADEQATAAHAVQHLASALAQVSDAGLPSLSREVWSAQSARLQAGLDAAARAIEATPDGRDSLDLEALRSAFEGLSGALIEVDREFGHGASQPRFEVHCPMASDGAGASWLQLGEEIRNPYFGAPMLRCGVVTRTSEGS